MIKEDYSGRIFGRWELVKEDIEGYESRKAKGNRDTYYICKCSCYKGTIRSVNLNSLKRGVSLSCGCYNKEVVIERCKKYNIYNLTGEYGIGYTTKGEEFWFDLKHYDKIYPYCWSKNKRKYIESRKNGKSIRMNRLIMDCPDGFVVDHINGDGSEHDNRECNLRICTQQENTFNNKKAKGVHLDKKNNRWMAYITINRKRKHLGYYDTEEEALIIRREAEQKYYGEFAPIRQE